MSAAHMFARASSTASIAAACGHTVRGCQVSIYHRGHPWIANGQWTYFPLLPGALQAGTSQASLLHRGLRIRAGCSRDRAGMTARNGVGHVVNPVTGPVASLQS